ncbi:MAG: NTP transferase domain-containing protein [Gammaproteobacteria bacterium]|nr:NTP transferase domain-containing protein [Gammaproteobacteria bacterium]
MSKQPGQAPLRGLVLAGGRSDRLGRDKAALAISGMSLLERAVTLLSAAVDDVMVSVRPDQRADHVRRRFRLVLDDDERIGPAAGVLAAHRLDPRSAWLVLACDMPRVSAAHLQALVAARRPDRGGTAYRSITDDRPEPLCAIFEPATLTALREAVDAGHGSSLRDLLLRVHPVLLDAPGRDALGSINTTEDLENLTRS